MTTPSPGAQWLTGARSILDHIERTQMATLEAVADRCAEIIGDGGLVHLFGTGHSRIPLEEMFPRYGSYPGFHPMAELSMTFHTQVVGANGQRQAMFIERTPGLAAQILRSFTFKPGGLMIIFSTSGSTTVPIEMAVGAQALGLTVVAVTSLPAADASAAPGPLLRDVAEIVIDLGTPPGDALVDVGGPESMVGPGSTIANTAVVNLLKVLTAERLHASGTLPPVITGPVHVGPTRSAELFDAAYDEHGRRIARALARPDPDRDHPDDT